MFYVAAYDETITRPRFKSSFASYYLKPSPDNVHKLLMRMAMACTNPTFLHMMLGQHEFIVERADATCKPRFRMSWFGIDRLRECQFGRFLLLHSSSKTPA